MRNHSKYLLLSLVIHLGTLLGLFGLYTYFFSSIKPFVKEKKICVNLQHITPVTAIGKKTKPLKKNISHPKKIKQVKNPHKKRVKKLTVTKSKIIKKKIPIQKKIIKKEPKVAQTLPIEEKKQTIITVPHIVQKKTSLKEIYLKNNLTQIAALIQENLYYPRRARKRGIEGDVTVHFVLHVDATVTQISTLSSTSGILTRAAIKTISELSGQFPKPPKTLTLNVPIRYTLH